MREGGRSIIHLDLGDPAFPTPPHIVEAAYRALRGGYTHYTESRGLPEFRAAVAEREGSIGLEVDPDGEVMATLGASFAIYLVLLAFVKPGDEVVVPSPCWFVYPEAVRLVGGRCVYVNFGDEYRVDAGVEEALKEAVSDKTRMLIVNSPHNPTGGVLDVDAIKLLRDIAVDHDLLILSDEIYRSILYDGARHVSIATLPGMWGRTIVVNSLSKTYAMSGWRIGYILAPREFIDEMARLQLIIATCPSSFVQVAAAEALRGSQECVEELVRRCDEARRAAMEILGELEGVRLTKPRGAFYLFPELSEYGWDSTSLANALREKAGVSVMPGSMFGPGGEYHIRISYACPLPQVVEGVSRIARFLMGLS